MLIEMSYPVSPSMPIYPGSPVDEFAPFSRITNGDNANTSLVRLYTHNGTHVDAPFHFYDKGKTIDVLSIEDFSFSKPLMVSMSLSKSALISVENLKAAGNALYDADILLLNTGYYQKRSIPPIYTDDFPSLSVEAAKFIRTELLNVKAVAIDTLSIESVYGANSKNVVHKTLLASDVYSTRTILIFEDVNFAPVVNRSIARIYAFPIRFVGLDGSPVTIVAEVK